MKKEIFNKKYTIYSDGKVFSNISRRFMKTQKRGRYESVVCCGTRYSVHRLVAEAFIPNPDDLKTVNHIDGNKLNNSVENLEWCSQKDNIKHAWQTGLAKTKVGENKHSSILDNMHILTIATLKDNYDRNKLAEYLPVRNNGKATLKSKREQIRRIIKGERWQHLNHLFN